MAYELKVDYWDKKEPINGVSAEDIMNKHITWTATDPALLVYSETRRGKNVQRVEQIDMMIQVLELDPMSSDEEVRQALYNYVNKEYLAEQAEKEAAEKEAAEKEATDVESEEV